jgi:hypothetical protein
MRGFGSGVGNHDAALSGRRRARHGRNSCARSVVPRVLGQDLAEMSLAEDQHVIKALVAKCPHKSFPLMSHPAGAAPLRRESFGRLARRYP